MRTPSGRASSRGRWAGPHRAGWSNLRRAFVLALGLSGGGLATGCGIGSESAFTSGLDLTECNGTFPICATTAGCILGPGQYLEGAFPGARQFIVVTPDEESVITVDIFFRTQEAVGFDTEISWFEPGCIDVFRYRSGGIDIFQEAGNDRVLSVSQQVFEVGEHLVEVFSDARAEYLIRAQVD